MTIVKNSGEHLLALINDVLELSKVKAGHAELNEQAFNLHELLHGLAQMFKMRAEQKGLKLNLEIDENLPTFIKTDSQKLRQVLTNIISNAIKFTNQGSITINANQQNETSAMPLLNFQISDTGCGIPDADIEKLFDPFVQLESRNSQNGTGLGLSISNQFVRFMGGAMSVKSILDKGSTFSFYIHAQITHDAAFERSQSDKRVYS